MGSEVYSELGKPSTSIRIETRKNRTALKTRGHKLHIDCSSRTAVSDTLECLGKDNGKYASTTATTYVGKMEASWRVRIRARSGVVTMPRRTPFCGVERFNFSCGSATARCSCRWRPILFSASAAHLFLASGGLGFLVEGLVGGKVVERQYVDSERPPKDDSGAG